MIQQAVEHGADGSRVSQGKSRGGDRADGFGERIQLVQPRLGDERAVRVTLEL